MTRQKRKREARERAERERKEKLLKKIEEYEAERKNYIRNKYGAEIYFDKATVHIYSSLKEIDIVNNDLNDKREQIKREIDLYNTRIQNLTINEDIQNKNQEIEKLLDLTLNSLKNSSNKWAKKFDNILEKEKF